MKAMFKGLAIGLFGLGTCLASCIERPETEETPQTVTTSPLLGHPTTIGVARGSGADKNWLLRDSNTPGAPTYNFIFGATSGGGAGMGGLNVTPIVGDWNGNGATTIGVVVREPDGNLRWKLHDSLDDQAPEMNFLYGNASAPYNDVPVVGDWDGNGTSTIGVYRRGAGSGGTGGGLGTTAQWLLRNQNTPGDPQLSFLFGTSSDEPIVGDWDGNGTSDGGFLRKSGNDWRWFQRNIASTAQFNYGSWVLGDIPVAGDWDGNGTTTIGVVRPDGNWLWLLRNQNTAGNPDPLYNNLYYGSVALDKPVAGIWTF